jgi:potassium efflux system protein
MSQAARSCTYTIANGLMLEARETIIRMLLLAAASLSCLGSADDSQAQQSSFNTPQDSSPFRPVSSPLRPSPAPRFQESDGQRLQEKPEAVESATAEAVPGRGSALEDVEQSLKILEDYAERTPDASEEIKNLVEGAKLQLNKAREEIAAAAAFDEQARTAPAQITSLEQKLANEDFEVDLTFNEQTPIAKLPPLDQLQTDLVTKQDAFQQALKPVENLTAAELRQRISSIKTKATGIAAKLEEVERQIQTAPLSEDEQFIQARRWSLEAERLKLNASLRLGNSEIRFREATSNLPELQNEVAQKQAAKLEKEISITEDAISRIRSQEIENLEIQSVNTQRKVSPPLQAIAQSNTALTRELSNIANEIKALDNAQDAIKKDTLRVKREEGTTKERIKVVGLSDSFGQMLQRDRAGLADTQSRHVPINQRNQQIAESQIAIFRWEDELAKLSDIPEATSATVELLVAQAGETSDPKSNQQLEDETGELLKLRKDILTRLKQLEKQKNSKLVALETEQEQLRVACESYASLIDENILWVRSVPIVSLADAQAISSVAGNLVNPKRWSGVWNAIEASFRNRFLLSTLMTLVAVAMFLFRGSVIESTRLDGEKAIKRSCRDIGITLTTYLRTAALAITVLSPLVLLGWLLTNNFEATRFAVSLGKACYWTFFIGMPFEFLRQTCRLDGLAHSHFAWTERTRSVLWNNLTWFMPIGLPLIALLTWLPMVGSDYRPAAENDANATAVALLETPTSLDFSVAGTGGEDSPISTLSSSFEFSGSNAWNRLGRIVLLVLLLVSLVFTFRTLHPKHGVLIDSSSTVFSQTVWLRIGYVLFISAIVIPLVLILMAIVGYYFSAIQIGKSLLTTIALAIGVAVVYSGAMRFLLVRRRHLRYEQLVHQRNQAKLALEKQGGLDAGGTPAEMIDIELQNDPGLDITDVSDQRHFPDGFSSNLVGYLAVPIASLKDYG